MACLASQAITSILVQNPQIPKVMKGHELENDLLSTLAYMALLFVLATLPGDASSGGLISMVPSSLHDLAHVPAYGFLALLWITTLKNWGMAHQGSLVLATFLASTYGALTEICQIWAPGRFPSVSDGLLDIVGSLLVVSMYQMPGFPRYGLNEHQETGALKSKGREIPVG